MTILIPSKEQTIITKFRLNFLNQTVYMRKYITEYIGTMFLMLIILTAGDPLAIGAVLMAMIFAGAHISGAHYNPAVTLAIVLRGRMGIPEAIGYVMVQIAGALTAVLLNTLLTNDAVPASVSVEVTPAIIAEVLGTCALAYVVLNVATAKGTAANGFYGLAIGFTVFACAVGLGKFSGGAFNPAVAIGACVAEVFQWKDLWIYLVGCFGGAALAALIFRINNRGDN
jgi:aquaporin Z